MNKPFPSSYRHQLTTLKILNKNKLPPIFIHGTLDLIDFTHRFIDLNGSEILLFNHSPTNWKIEQQSRVLSSRSLLLNKIRGTYNFHGKILFRNLHPSHF